jgi:glycerol-3-phosphate acyltransferase PlsY
MGKRWAYVCFALDMLKGFIPTFGTMLVAKHISLQANQTGALSLWLVVGCAAIAGHVFPIYVGFKGGKGVATSFGVAIGLWPYFTLCTLPAFVVWAAVFLRWRYVSLASISAAATFPIAFIIMIVSLESWTIVHLWPFVIAAIAIPLAVVILHSDNIKRLMSGTEHKISIR